MADCPVNVHPRRAASRFDSSEAVTRCLVLQTDHPRLVRAALEALRKPSLYPGCKLALVCRQEDFESFQDLPDVELMAFPRRGNYRFADLWRRISEFSPDLICAILNRRPIFRKQKLLFFLLPVRRRLIFDGRMKPYHLRFANLRAILRRSRYEEDLPGRESTILFLPTEADSISLEVLERLRDRKIIGPGRVRVLCSKTKKTHYESRPEVSEVITYEPGKTLANLRTVLKLARMRVDVLAAIFSGRPIFRLQKLMFLLLPARSRLVFNEHRDCWYLRRTPRSLLRIWRTSLASSGRESWTPRGLWPISSLRSSRWESTILYLPTEEDSAALKVLGRLQDSKIVGPGRIRVLCSKTKMALYESRPEVSEVVTYEPGRTLANLRTVLKLARMRVDVLAAIFSGRPIFRLHKLMFLLLPARSRLVFNENRDCWYLRRTPRSLLRIWRTSLASSGRESWTPRGLWPISSLRSSRWESTILYLPTEEDSAALEGPGTTPGPEDRQVPAGSSALLENKKTLYESRPEVSEVVTYEPGRTLANLRTILKLARMRVDVLAAILSGKPIYRLHKLMFLLLPARSRLVFNENRDCWYLRRTPRSLLRIWRTSLASSGWESWTPRGLWPISSLRSSRWESTILFLPTEADAGALEVLGRLQDRKITGPGQVRVFCSIAKKTHYESRPEVSEVVTYEPGRTLANLRTILRLARMRVDVLAAIFSGRPIFRLQKLMFLLLPARSRLVFNEHRDCWYLRRTPRSLLRIWRTSLASSGWESWTPRGLWPISSLRSSRWESTILFLPTEADAGALEVLGRLQDRKITGPGQVRVFCSIAKKTHYESRPEVSEVVTYEPGRTLANLRTMLRLARMRVDVLAAIFSGRPIFRLQKLMFLLLPARSRLVFNENRDCWYLRRTPRGLFKLSKTPSLAMGYLPRKILKGVLFFPRYLYLVLWLLLGSLRKGGSKRLVVFRRHTFPEHD